MDVIPNTSEIFKGSIPFVANSTETLEIERTDFIDAILLYLTGAVTVGGVAWTGIGTESPANLIRKIEVTWGGETIKSITGAELYRLTCFDSLHNIARTQPVAAGLGAKTFACPLVIPFSMPHSIHPVDTVLPSFLRQGLFLKVTWGNGDELGKKDAGTTIVMGTTYLDVTVRYKSIPTYEKVARTIPLFRELGNSIVIPATSSNWAVDLITGAGLYRSVMLQAYPSTFDNIDTAAGIINAVGVRHSTSMFLKSSIPMASQDLINARSYGFAPAPGNTMLDFCDEGRLSQAVPSNLLNSLQLLLDVTVAGTPVLHWVTREIVPQGGTGVLAAR